MSRMKRTKLAVWFFLVAVTAVAVSAQTPDNRARTAFEFLQGTWKADGRDTYEKWEVFEKAFRGKGYKLRDNVESISEELEIREIDGAVYYLATVASQNDGATIRFKMTEIGPDRLVFENPQHDFPKKIIYRRVSDEELAVQVLGADDKGFAMRFLRQKPRPN